MIVPMDTIENINPIENPCPNKSLIIEDSIWKCSFLGISILASFQIKKKQIIVDMPCAITVATAAPKTPISRIVIQNISRAILMIEEQKSTIKGLRLSPIARNIPAPKL